LGVLGVVLTEIQEIGYSVFDGLIEIRIVIISDGLLCVLYWKYFLIKNREFLISSKGLCFTELFSQGVR
jgi:hypothetical protein